MLQLTVIVVVVVVVVVLLEEVERGWWIGILDNGVENVCEVAVASVIVNTFERNTNSIIADRFFMLSFILR